MFEIINDTEFEISIGDGKVTVFTSVPNVSCSAREPGRKLKQLFDILSRAETFGVCLDSMMRGFHAVFKNGVVVSVQWGLGNYGDNHWRLDESGERMITNNSNEAETAVWIKGGPWITDEYKGECGGVLGYQSPEQVLHLLQWAERFDVSTIKPKELPEGSISS